MSHLLHQKLYNEIVGSFDFTGKTHVYSVDESLEQGDLYTLVHEETHRKATSSSTFGELQFILAFVSRSKAFSAIPSWISQADKLLQQTIQFSFLTHEGYAVYRELIFGNLTSNQNRTEETKPEEYQLAYRKYKAALECFPKELGFLEVGLIRILAEISLNTPILNQLFIEKMEVDKFLDALSIPENQPDFRLDMVTNAIQRGVLTDEFIDKIINKDKELLNKYGYSIQNSLREIILGGPTKRLTDFQDEWDKFENEYIYGELKKLDLGIKIIEPLTAQKKYFDFHSKAVQNLKTYGIKLPHIKTAAFDFESEINFEQVEYIPEQHFKEVLVPIETAGDTLTELKNTYSHISYILEIDRTINFFSKQFVKSEYYYSVSAIPFVPVPSEALPKGQTEGLTPIYKRYIFFGSKELVHNLIEKMKDKTLLVTVSWGYSIMEKWKTPKDFDFENKKTFVTIVQSTNGKNIYGYLQDWQEIGVKYVWTIKRYSNYIYYAIWLETGLIIITRLTKSFLTRISLYEQNMARWLAEKLNGDVKESQNILQHQQPFGKVDVASLAILNELGAFYHDEHNYQ